LLDAHSGAVVDAPGDIDLARSKSMSSGERSFR
jgi:hypothetical protein